MNDNHTPTRTITIDSDACKGCHLCIDQCPREVLAVSENRNTRGYLMPVAVRIDDCVACMMCEMICPDLAIVVEEFENEK